MNQGETRRPPPGCCNSIWVARNPAHALRAGRTLTRRRLLSSQVQATAAAAFSFLARTGCFLRASGLCATGFTIMSINAFCAST